MKTPVIKKTSRAGKQIEEEILDNPNV